MFKPLFQALYLEIKPLKSTLVTLGENSKITITQTALDRILWNSGFKWSKWETQIGSCFMIIAGTFFFSSQLPRGLYDIFIYVIVFIISILKKHKTSFAGWWGSNRRSWLKEANLARMNLINFCYVTLVLPTLYSH